MKNAGYISGFGKTVAAQEFTLLDNHGKTLAVLTATHGKPVLAFYNGKGQVRAWFTLTADEKPDIRFLDDAGKVCWEYSGDVEKSCVFR
jgi:hypothetical protein